MPFVQPAAASASRPVLSSDWLENSVRPRGSARSLARRGLLPRPSRLVSRRHDLPGARRRRRRIICEPGGETVNTRGSIRAVLLGSASMRCLLRWAQDNTELLNRMKAMEDRIKALEAEVQSLKGQPPAAARRSAGPTILRLRCRPPRRPRSRRSRWQARAPRRNSAAPAGPPPRR